MNRLAADDQEYDFDASAFHKKAWELGGFVELKGEHAELDQVASPYQMRFEDDARETFDRFTGTLEFEALARYSILTGWARSHSVYRNDSLGDEQDHKLYEAALSLQPRPSRAFDVGKQVARWGKGYAWNPVGFIERPKEPDDPALSREGFWMARGDWISSFAGELETMAFTPALLPTYDGLNDDFGEPDHINPAAKLYVLYKDTDLDFLLLGEGSRSARYGVDFSKNLAENFEVHGEFAYISEILRQVWRQSETITESDSAVSYLLGLRYLTRQEVTIIGEYYYNGAGYSKEEIREFYRRVHRAAESWDKSLLNELNQLSKKSYGKPNPGRQYLYLRAAWKEPFDLLYFTPSLIGILNLEDRSYSLIPEIFYRGLNNFEVRLRLNIFEGDRFTEYGEKLNDYKLELRLRYFF